MTAKQLTDSILQLAIQGKLVPQDPNDEPASVLLERIRDEKHRLVEEGVFKKKVFEETSIDEAPYIIPDSWVWVRLENITTYISRGKSPVYSETKKYPVVAQKCNQWSGFSLEKAKFIDPKTVDKYSEERLLQDGDLLWNSTGLGTLGRMAIYDSSVNEYGWAVADSHVTVIRTRPDFTYYKYLYYYFASPEVQRVIEDKSDGSTKQKELAQETVKKYEIPLPPLTEQHRIVKRIEEILPFVKEYGEAYEEASMMDAELPDKLRKSILQDAIMGKLGTQDPKDEPAIVLLEQIREEKKRLVKLGILKKKDLEETPVNEEEEPFTIPESWAWSKIGSLFLHSSGKQLSGGNNEGSLHQYITTSNLYWDRFVLDNLKSMYYKDSELEKCTATRGDLLVCEGGDVGRCAIWPYEYNICLQNHVHRLRPILGINTRYIMYTFMLYKAKGDIGGKGIGIKGLSASALKNIIIPLPPIAEQYRIVQRIEELYAEIDKMTINNDINKPKTEETEE